MFEIKDRECVHWILWMWGLLVLGWSLVALWGTEVDMDTELRFNCLSKN